MTTGSVYAERREALAAALLESFGPQIDLQLQAGGMHLLARFPNCTDDEDWVARARASGLVPDPLSRWRVERDCGQGLLLGFTNIAPKDAGDAAMRLKTVIEDR